MDLNLPGAHQVAVLETIDPVSQGAGTVLSGWVSAKNFHRFMAIIDAGVLGASATLDAKIRQATDASGTGAKDVTGSSITQLTKAGSDDNKQAIINFSQASLDFNNGFNFIAISVTVATAASLVSAVLLGLGPRLGPASDNDVSTVDEIVYA